MGFTILSSTIFQSSTKAGSPILRMLLAPMTCVKEAMNDPYA